MSDFTDDEDRQLIQLALTFSRSRRYILWEKLKERMKGTKKSKEALRQRLKTLKRTHGRNLEQFPAWFFKTNETRDSLQRLHKSSDTSASEKDDNMLTERAMRCESNKLVSESLRSQKFSFRTRNEPLASLLLLASVATTAI
ncbi:hypothetical protein PHYSODRAFT_433994 [Plasmopara halstedii]|uniref:Uncharacterized protein n=1 Tax=Plasmopara halstedii TaxID=4781 RepID=A0A0N7L3C4_PLAHL|nr:hypothetical protein PHYSODRAFT_433994 [Plasmopara halstedii]CEG35483.1 hypothetical protein PHYSODRAFT_433994 [Plasmopara halstedii]|eukprot:XP_024571852.1 hypothetical protein PHYSODRAFT_433994 [Plasmopara halstedii]